MVEAIHAAPLALVVEDEALIALATEDILVAGGFRTMVVSSELEAIAAITDDIAVSVINLRLHGDIAGQRIISALRCHIPDLPIVVTTGFNHVAPEADLRGLGWPTVRLQKPEHFSRLIAAVRDVMEQARLGIKPPTQRRRNDHNV
jgi:DNA-binding NtrC family response regulator